MSSRLAAKTAAREARLAAEARRRADTNRRRRLRMAAGVGSIAVLLVVAAVALSNRGTAAVSAASGGKVLGATASSRLFAGIPQRGVLLGRSDAPVRLVEFADLQCPYCDEYAIQALPTLVTKYVRTGKLQMSFENLSFIGPDSVSAGRAASAAARQDKLWNFVDLVYLNQGRENSGYVTATYLRRLLSAVPALDVTAALEDSRSAASQDPLTSANRLAEQDGVGGTPTFLIGRAGGPLSQFTPSSLSAAPFATAINRLLPKSG